MKEKLNKCEIDIDTAVKIDFDVPSDIKELMNKMEVIYFNVELPARECTLYGAGMDADSYFFDECDFRSYRNELGEKLFNYMQSGIITEAQRDILRKRYYPAFKEAVTDDEDESILEGIVMAQAAICTQVKEKARKEAERLQKQAKEK